MTDQSQHRATQADTITVNADAATATVCLNRPDLHNAFNQKMIRELTETFEAFAGDESTRVIVLKGNGRSFCAGADVGWMRNSLDLTTEENVADAERMSDMFAAIEAAPQAVIGRVHGAVLGGGMGLIAVCDIVVAAESASFGFTEARLGIIPAVISRFVVPKTGPGWTRRLFVTGERFDAGRARDIGLVHEIVPEQDLDRTIASLADSVLACAPNAVRDCKQLIAALLDTPVEGRRALTAGRIAAARTSAEGQEGLAPGWQATRAS
jgi:methylglutaconyl-CoA hydratase